MSFAATESYITLSLDKRIRSYYAQFRSGILPIMVEIGRYYNIPLEQRFCPLCKDKFGLFIEDEYHLLCICQHYNNLRVELYREANELFPNFLTMDNFEKYLYLNSNLQMYTAKFIYNAMQMRQNFLYNKYYAARCTYFFNLCHSDL